MAVTSEVRVEAEFEELAQRPGWGALMVELCRRKPLGAGETPPLEVPRRQRLEPVEQQQVGSRTEFTIFCRRGAQRAF